MHLHANKSDQAAFDQAKKDPLHLSSLALFVPDENLTWQNAADIPSPSHKSRPSVVGTFVPQVHDHLLLSGLVIMLDVACW